MYAIIARGWKSEICQDTPDTVCKLYELGYSPQRVHNEFAIAKKVYAQGRVAVPQPLRVVNFDGRHGIIFQFIKGSSLLQHAQRRPWVYRSCVQDLAKLHKQIHSVTLDGLLRQSDVFGKLIVESERIPQTDKPFLLELLQSKKSLVLCHGSL